MNNKDIVTLISEEIDLLLEGKPKKGEYIKTNDNEIGLINKVSGKTAYVKFPSTGAKSFDPIYIPDLELSIDTKHKGKSIWLEESKLFKEQKGKVNESSVDSFLGDDANTQFYNDVEKLKASELNKKNILKLAKKYKIDVKQAIKFVRDMWATKLESVNENGEVSAEKIIKYAMDILDDEENPELDDYPGSDIQDSIPYLQFNDKQQAEIAFEILKRNRVRATLEGDAINLSEGKLTEGRDFVIIDPRGNARPVGMKVQGAQYIKKMGGPSKGWHMVLKKNALKARRAIEKNGGNSTNSKIQNIMFDLMYEGKNKGLWANIHAKRKRGEKPAKKGEKGYPKTLDIDEGNEEVDNKYLKKVATDLAYSMPNHTKYDDKKGPTDSQIMKAMKKYYKDLFQYSTTSQKKLAIKIVKNTLSEGKLNESMIGIKTKANFKPLQLKGALEKAKIKGFQMNRLSVTLTALKLDKKYFNDAKKIIDDLGLSIMMAKESVNEANFYISSKKGLLKSSGSNWKKPQLFKSYKDAVEYISGEKAYWVSDDKGKKVNKYGELEESKLNEKLARGLKPLLVLGSKITKKVGEDTLVKLSDKFDRIDDEQADDIASHLNMAIELMQDGYPGDATKKLKQFNKACKDALKGKSVKSAFEGVNEGRNDKLTYTWGHINRALMSLRMPDKKILMVLSALKKTHESKVSEGKLNEYAPSIKDVKKAKEISFKNGTTWERSTSNKKWKTRGVMNMLDDKQMAAMIDDAGGNRPMYEGKLNEMDINDPILVAIRARKTMLAKNAKIKIPTEKQYYKLMDAEIDIINQIKDARRELEQLDSDMNQDAGQKGDEWTDDDANRYGGDLDKLQTKVEKLVKRKLGIKKAIMTYRIN